MAPGLELKGRDQIGAGGQFVKGPETTCGGSIKAFNSAVIDISFCCGRQGGTRDAR